MRNVVTVHRMNSVGSRSLFETAVVLDEDEEGNRKRMNKK
jgi:hypothetical protein